MNTVTTIGSIALFLFVLLVIGRIIAKRFFDRGTYPDKISIGIAVAFVILYGVILVSLLLNPPREPETQVVFLPTTAAPLLTPTPIPVDTNAISFDTLYTHPDDVFSIAQPTGWEPGNPISTEFIYQITMQHTELQSVIDVTIPILPEPITRFPDLDAYFSPNLLADSWRAYSTWEETDRSIENNRLVMDYEVTILSTNFIARDVAWLQDGRIIRIRVVILANQPDLLTFLVDNLVPTFELHDQTDDG